MARKGFSILLSAGAIVLGVATAQPVAAQDMPGQPLKVEFDSHGRLGLSDRALLDKLGMSPEGQNTVRFDLKAPDGVPVSGEKQNMVCLIIPRK